MLKLACPQAGDGVRRRHLDPVHLAGAQRGETGIGLRDRQQQHPVELRHPGLVPVLGVLRQLRRFPWGELGQPEGAGAGGRHCAALPQSRPPCSKLFGLVNSR